MARKLSSIMVQINADLKRENSEAKAFTELEFRTNSDAMKLLSMKNGSYISEIDDLFERSFEYEYYIRTVAQATNHINASMIRKFTADALGLHKEPLINRIADVSYFDIATDNFSCHECGKLRNNNVLQIKIDMWVVYCNLVDDYIKFIKQHFNKWETMTKQEKSKQFELLKLISESKLGGIPTPSLDIFIRFVEKGYGLNQGTLAKAEYLLELNLPNINSLNIAKDVTIHTSLNKPQ